MSCSAPLLVTVAVSKRDDCLFSYFPEDNFSVSFSSRTSGIQADAVMKRLDGSCFFTVPNSWILLGLSNFFFLEMQRWPARSTGKPPSLVASPVQSDDLGSCLWPDPSWWLSLLELWGILTWMASWGDLFDGGLAACAVISCLPCDLWWPFSLGKPDRARNG